ncbi:MAG: 16S rRNA (guanine(527)-N(7))-methyltransferase RsmG [Bacteroidetes bacterium]|nr:16S rRNA (guanine(527)-N(7))-methyltransferase RsmG [Bacteroidota bacterium]
MTEEDLWLYTFLKKNDLPITDIELRQLSRFKQLLLEWNQKINLISRKNEEAVWKQHIAFSLTMLIKLYFPSKSHLLDLGTGGGFPGIPLSILRQDCSFLLLDSTQKKINAVQSMIEILQLSNVKTIWGRAEEIQAKSEYRNRFDFVVARSVSNLSNLIDWGIPFLKRSFDQKEKFVQTNKFCFKKPSLITFKGGEIDEEIFAAQKKFSHIMVHTLPLTFTGSEEFENRDKKLIILTHK